MRKKRVSISSPEIVKALHKGFKKAKRCGSPKRDGTPCQNIPRHGRTRCKFHGGNTKQGIASGTFKTGKTSKFLPERLMAQFQNSKIDQNLLELRYEISLVDTRIVELTAELDKKSNTQHFSNVQKSIKRIKRNLEQGADPDASLLTIDSIEHSLQAGIKNSDVWKKLGDQIDRRQRLAESERKRLVDGQHMISSERMMQLVARILKTILEHVPDVQTRHKIRSGLISIFPAQVLTNKLKNVSNKEIEWLQSGEEENNAVQEKKRATN